MRENISFDVSETARERPLAIVADRNTPAKLVWRAKIILVTADGLGTMAIMREAGKSEPLAVAGAFHARGCRGAFARQDAAAWHAAAT